MRTRSIILCAATLLTAQAISSAQKTEVSVRKGQVIAETATESRAVAAGRKAILTADKHLTVTVDDPMVDDVMEIYKWVEAEKQAQREQIDTTTIMVIRIDSEHLLTLAYYAETQNAKSEPSDAHQLNISILEEARFYDLEGNLLPFDLEKIDGERGYYTLHFPKSVEPGRNFRYICVGKARGTRGLRKEGPLWHLRPAWSTPYRLNYCRIILPESAIFVDSSRPVTMLDAVDGRVAVTCRAYTGAIGDGKFHIAFLWPDKDGTTLAGLPPQYRGLRSEQEREFVEAGQLKIAKIMAGETFEDQSSPLTTLLTTYSAIAQKDKDLLLSLIGDQQLKEAAARHTDAVLAEAGQMFDTHEFLNTPAWPEEPQDGYVHSVNLCRKGSLLWDATVEMVFQGGKWYLQGFKQVWDSGGEEPEPEPSGRVTISKASPNLSAATYEGLKPGKFMRRWLILGPTDYPVRGDTLFSSEEGQKLAFDIDPLGLEHFEPKVTLENVDYEWAALQSDYGIVDLTQVSDEPFLIAYVRAQIDMPEEARAVLGIGFDDSVKVWFNGQLVHERWEIRGVIPDDDRVPVAFKKGSNQLVLKIQNRGGPWGFSCRLLESEAAGRESR